MINVSRIIFLFIIFSLFFLSGCFDCRKSYLKEKDQLIKVKILKVYLDEKNHNTETIDYLNEDSMYKQDQIRYIPGLFENAEVGDSLIKEKGSTEYKLKKKDTTMIFLPNCGGLIIK